MRRLGLAVFDDNAAGAVEQIEQAEHLGIHAAWMTTAGARLDNITTLAAAAMRTRRILLGTAIVPTFPRHPLVAVQQSRVLNDLAPGRFRLGLGPSHRPMIESMGIAFDAPLAHLREYVHVVKALHTTGKVDFDGRHYRAHDAIPAPIDVPVMTSALQRGSFELGGEIADGVITWICPQPYLRDVGLPAMQAGAAKAGRAVPPLVAHAPVCVHDDAGEARAAVRATIMNLMLPFYRRMMVAAGFPEAESGQWSDAMIDATVLHGAEDTVARRIEGLFATGATEVLVTTVPAGRDPAASHARTVRLLGDVARAMDAEPPR
ncbi:MAG: LLM class flavin-dependent oxidoreductase [Gammaproteobacteria bacterium]